MNYIILDLEWNQPDNADKFSSATDIPFEIIEIGAVKLNENREYLGSFHQVIMPKLYTHIHRITQELTNISIDELKNGKAFPVVIREFLDWCGNSCTFCTWGSMDLTELQRNMNYYKLPLLPFPVYYYDLQKIFSLAFEDGKLRRSLEYAVDYLNIQKDDIFHRAVCDAEYTSKVFKCIDELTFKPNYSIDTYQIPASKHDEIYAYYDRYSKYISRGFENKVDVMSDKTVTSTTCYKCGKKLKKKIRWFSGNSKIYYCLCICPEHGYLKGKIRMKHHDSGKYYAVKTLKLTDRFGADSIYERQAETRKKRREKRKQSKKNTEVN